VLLGGGVGGVDLQDLVELFAGFFEAPGSDAGDAEVDPGQDEVGSELDDGGKFFTGGFEVTDEAELDAEQITGFDKVGLEFGGLAEGLGGFVSTAEGGEGIGEVSEESGVVGVACSDLFVESDGFLVFFLAMEDLGGLEACLFEIGAQVEGLSQGGQGVVQPAEPGEQPALLEEGSVVMRQEFGHALPRFDSGLEVIGGLEELGEVLVQARVIGVSVDGGVVDVFGFEVTAGVQFVSELRDVAGEGVVAGLVIGLVGERWVLEPLQHALEDAHPVPVGQSEAFLDDGWRGELGLGLG